MMSLVFIVSLEVRQTHQHMKLAVPYIIAALEDDSSSRKSVSDIDKSEQTTTNSYSLYALPRTAAN